MSETHSERIKTLLVDDESPVRAALRELLLRHFPFVEVVGEASNIPEAVKQIHKLNPDLVFLDIEMPGYSGLQLLEFFNPQEVNFDIVFVTAFNEYAIQAFKISAFDYLLKPVDIQELSETLKRFSERKSKQKIFERVNLLKETFASPKVPTQIAIASLQGIDFVELDQVMLLEADGTYTKIIRTEGEPVLSSKPLGEFENLLQSNASFFRVHRSYLINLHYVRKLSSKEGDIIILKNEMEVPLSRYRKKEFDAAISGFKI
jgi:two-component system, LytTR family, response regulator